MEVVRSAQELDCYVALVRLDVGDRVERVEEPPGVAVGLPLVEEDAVLAKRLHPGPRPVRSRDERGDAVDTRVNPGQGDGNVAAHGHASTNARSGNFELFVDPVEDA